jgi:hypothetical protein
MRLTVGVEEATLKRNVSLLPNDVEIQLGIRDVEIANENLLGINVAEPKKLLEYLRPKDPFSVSVRRGVPLGNRHLQLTSRPERVPRFGVYLVHGHAKIMLGALRPARVDRALRRKYWASRAENVNHPPIGFVTWWDAVLEK